jgi:hypothetical protein
LSTLDRWQAIALYLPQTDKEGTVIGTAQGPVRLSAEEEFRRFWGGLGLPPYRVAQLWQAQQEFQRDVQRLAQRRRQKIADKREKVRFVTWTER